MPARVKSPKSVSRPRSSTASPPKNGEWDELSKYSKSERHRIEHIHQALRRAWAQGNKELPNAQKFAESLKVTRQTIYSAIAAMQDDLGMPVEFVPQQNGYRYTELVVATPFCKMAESEMLAVYLSHEMLSAFHEMPLKKRAQSAFRKIIDLAGDAISFDAAMVRGAFSITPSGHPAYYHPRHFEMCSRALLRSEELELTYTSMHGENAGLPEKRRVQPLHLTFFEFAWYLLCWDPNKKAHRCFMLTRMNALKETKVKFERPKNFNAREILRRNFSIFTSGEPVPVRLEFSKRVRRLVKERKWHRTQKFSPVADDWLQMDLKVATTPDLVAWIASYLDDCRILEPASLREDVGRRQLRAARGNGVSLRDLQAAVGA